MHYSHPLRANDEENALASTDHRIDWLRSFSPGNMPDAVFDQADWHFVPVGGWSEVSGTGPHIRIGRVPINFHAAVATNVQFLQLLGQISKGRLASQQQDWEAARRHLSAVLEAPYFLEELLTPFLCYDVYYKLGLADFALGDHGAARLAQCGETQPAACRATLQHGIGLRRARSICRSRATVRTGQFAAAKQRRHSVWSRPKSSSARQLFCSDRRLPSGAVTCPNGRWLRRPW
jgi:hypothetical protein